MLLILYSGGKILGVIPGGVVVDGNVLLNSRRVATGLSCQHAYAPDQDISHLEKDDGNRKRIEGRWPEDIEVFSGERQTKYVGLDERIDALEKARSR